MTGPEEGRAKWQRGQGKGTQCPKGKQSQQQSWWDKDRDQRGYSKSNEDLKNVVKALGRLVLRQEDSLLVTQLDCQFVIFMKNKPDSDQAVNWSITNQLLSAGNHWRERKAQDPKALGQPLRTVLLSSWLTAIKYRINEFTSNPAVKDQAIQMGILANDAFPYMQWDPDASKHVRIAQDSPDPRSAAEDHHPSQRDWSLSPTEPHRGNGVRCHPLDSRDPEQNAGSASRLRADWETGPQLVYAPGSLNPETFQAGKISAGNRGGQDDPGTLRPVKLKIQQLQLCNPHQHSYAHAALLSLLWTAFRMAFRLHIRGYADSCNGSPLSPSLNLCGRL